MDDPQFVLYLRIGYVAAQVISLALYYFITLKVSMVFSVFDISQAYYPKRTFCTRWNSVIEWWTETGGRVTDGPQIRRKNDLTVLKYVNPPSAMVSC